MDNRLDGTPTLFAWKPGAASLVLDTPERIGALLAQLRAHGVPLHLRIGASLDAHESRVLTFDIHHRLMFITAPDDCFDGLLQHGAQLHVWGTHAGSHIEFETTHHSQVLLDDSLAACILRPERVECREHRTEPRVHVAPGQAQVQFTDGALSHSGQLVDVSEQGAGAVVEQRCWARVGEQLTCDLAVQETHIRTDAEVRSRIAQASGQRLGLLFSSLSQAQEAELGAAIEVLRRNAEPG